MTRLPIFLCLLQLPYLMRHSDAQTTITSMTTPWDVNSPRQNVIKIGLIVTEELQSEIGFSTTGGAIALALQQMRKYHLIDGVSFTFVLNYTDCTEASAAGIAVEMMKEKAVDLVIGPSCPGAVQPAAILGTYYQVLQLAWGYASRSSLTDDSRFPFLTVLTITYMQLGYSFNAILELYNWTTIGFFYVDDEYSVCTDMITDVAAACSSEFVFQADVVSTQRVFRTATRPSYVTALKRIKSRARIIGVCLPSNQAKRDFLIAIHEAEMDSEEYVYVLLDLKGLGFGQLDSTKTDVKLSDGKIPIWIDTVNGNTDGMDSVAAKAARRCLAIDLRSDGSVDGASALSLSQQIMDNVKGPPFYCNTTDCQQNTQRYSAMGSFTPQLYDALMYYAYALNISLQLDPINGIRNDSIFKKVRSSVSFFGWSGNISMTPNATRVPRQYVYGLDTQGNLQTFVNLTWTGNEYFMVATPLYADENLTIWANWNNKRPLSEPICGFLGASCPKSFWEQTGIFLVIAAGVFLILLIFFLIVIFYILRERRREQARQDAEWQIPFGMLERPEKGKKNDERSMYSLHSSKSSTSKFSVGSKAETSTLAYYFYRGEPILAYKYKIVVKLVVEDFTEFRMMRKIEHDNLLRFIGICHDHSPMLSIWKYASRGTLEEVMARSSINLDGFFVFSLIRDLIEGLAFLHKSLVEFHGSLTSSHCWIDDRWQLKIAGFGMRSLRRGDTRDKKSLLWMAPELLRNPCDGTREGDMYAFAIVCSEIVTRKSAYDLENRREKLEEVVYMVKRGSQIPMRPVLDIPDDLEVNPALLHMIRDCWAEDPSKRPGASTIRTVVKSMSQQSGRQQNLMDHVFGIMESYAETLEKEVQDRMAELVEEKKKSDILLYRMLPRQVADKLKLGQSVEPESFDSVTIFFSDVVQFTNLAAKCTPLQIVNLLNNLYTTFDTTIEQHSVYKVETIGDGYLCVSGLPHRNGIQHVKNICEMSLEFLQTVKVFRVPHLPSERINLRIGMHSGPCVAGVVGLAMPRYCLFGDSVNTASRMESNGKPGRIHMSGSAHHLLGQIGGYVTEPRGEVIIKGKGVMETFWLLGREGEYERENEYHLGGMNNENVFHQGQELPKQREDMQQYTRADTLPLDEDPALIRSQDLLTPMETGMYRSSRDSLNKRNPEEIVNID